MCAPPHTFVLALLPWAITCGTKKKHQEVQVTDDIPSSEFEESAFLTAQAPPWPKPGILTAVGSDAASPALAGSQIPNK